MNMPLPTESYIANMVVRNILRDIGEKLKNYETYKKNKEEHRKELLSHFGKECCYCGSKGKKEKLETDHIIGMNKRELGFDCLGNVAPACRSCNQKKNNLSKKNSGDKRYGWEIYLENLEKAGSINERLYKKKGGLIRSYMEKHRIPHHYFKIGSKKYKWFIEEIDNLSKKIEDLLSKEKGKLFQKHLKR